MVEMRFRDETLRIIRAKFMRGQSGVEMPVALGHEAAQ